MRAYKEKTLWKMNLLILRRSIPILAGMAVLILLVFPLSFVLDLIKREMSEARAKGLLMIHGLFPLGSLLPCLALVPAWMEENSSELLHAVCRSKTPCGMQLLWAFRFYSLLLLLPVMAACVLLQLTPIELFRMLAELLLVTGACYFLLLLLRSALLGGMLVTLYVLFCLLTCRSEEMKEFCILRPDLEYAGEFFFSEGSVLLPAALVLWVAAFLLERNRRIL